MSGPTLPPYGSAPPPSGGEHRHDPYPQLHHVPQDAPPPGPGVVLTPAAGGYGYSGHEPPRTATLGRVALVVGVVSLVGSVVNALVVAALFDPAALDQQAPTDTVGLVAAVGLAQVLLLWFGFGLWALVQGIVAIATRRGVGPGVGGVLLGLVGPWVGVVIAAVALVSEAAQLGTG